MKIRLITLLRFILSSLSWELINRLNDWNINQFINIQNFSKLNDKWENALNWVGLLKSLQIFEKFKICNKSTHLICVHCPFLYKYENIPIALNFICLNLQDTHQLDFNWKNTK